MLYLESNLINQKYDNSKFMKLVVTEDMEEELPNATGES
jgi:hypothetical protein